MKTFFAIVLISLGAEPEKYGLPVGHDDFRFGHGGFLGLLISTLGSVVLLCG